jgi:hypothetical protein
LPTLGAFDTSPSEASERVQFRTAGGWGRRRVHAIQVTMGSREVLQHQLFSRSPLLMDSLIPILRALSRT